VIRLKYVGTGEGGGGRGGDGTEHAKKLTLGPGEENTGHYA
jgi:hypothetical protein